MNTQVESAARLHGCICKAYQRFAAVARRTWTYERHLQEDARAATQACAWPRSAVFACSGRPPRRRRTAARCTPARPRRTAPSHAQARPPPRACRPGSAPAGTHPAPASGHKPPQHQPTSLRAPTECMPGQALAVLHLSACSSCLLFLPTQSTEMCLSGTGLVTAIQPTREKVGRPGSAQDLKVIRFACVPHASVANKPRHDQR